MVGNFKLLNKKTISNEVAIPEIKVIATEYENYRFSTVSFGPTSVPGTFAKAVSMAFQKLLDIVANYFNNVTVSNIKPRDCFTCFRKAFVV